MKKFFLTLAAFATVSSFTACKETTAEQPEETTTQVVEKSADGLQVETQVDSTSIEPVAIPEESGAPVIE